MFNKKQSQRPNIPDYALKDADYVDQINAFDLCEIQGRRSNQQDVLAYHDNLEKFATISNTDCVKILKSTVKKMQERHGAASVSEFFGATLSVAIAWVTDSILHVWIANVGDSAVYVTIFDDQNNSSSTHRLTYPHVPDLIVNPAEYCRVKAATDNTQPKKDFLGGCHRIGDATYQVALCRALGDNDVEPYGLCHEPEIFEYRFKLTETQRSKVTVACNGLEKRCSVSAINNFLYKTDQQKKNAAEALVNAAYQNGSRDNISVIVVTPGEKPASALIVDGHGVDKKHNKALDFAQKIAHSFYVELLDEIKKCTSIKEGEDYVNEVSAQFWDFFSQTNSMSELIHKISDFLDNLSKTKNAICLEIEAGFYRGGNVIQALYQEIKGKILAIGGSIESFEKDCDAQLTIIINDRKGPIEDARKLINEMPPSSYHGETDNQYLEALGQFSDPFNVYKLRSALPIRVVLSKNSIELAESLQDWMEGKLAKLLTQYFNEVKSQWHWSRCVHVSFFKNRLSDSLHFRMEEENNSVLPKNR